tara:strand:+ start:128 stop:274 length:147 start_codon:yes stop_codon:yes gene_type:complete
LLDVVAGGIIGIYVSEFIYNRRMNNLENKLEFMPLLGKVKGIMITKRI